MGAVALVDLRRRDLCKLFYGDGESRGRALEAGHVVQDKGDQEQARKKERQPAECTRH
jgi:hypothetical protein